MRDLFGNEIPEQTDYERYMASKKWAEKRGQKLAEAGYVCQRCGLSAYSVDLQVHHLNYDRLGHELMTDLQVVCPQCHEFADAERVIEQTETKQYRKKNGALAVGFKNWLHRGDTGRMTARDAFYAKQKFLKMLLDKTGRSYSLDLGALGWKDPDPEWKP